MDTADLVSKAAEYTEKFVNAAIPVAKKAYEIGLLTIRIDAIQTIIMGIVLAVVGAYLHHKLYQHKKSCLDKLQIYCEKYYQKYNQHSDETWFKYSSTFDTVGYVATFILTTIPLVISAALLLRIWLWVQLFAPDLWLAHEAIIKVMEHVAK